MRQMRPVTGNELVLEPGDSRLADAVLEIAGALFCVFDPEGRFLRFNRACELVSGYSFREIEGRPFYDFLIPPEEVDAVRAALGRLRAGAQPAPNENHWRTRDGRQRLISWSNVAVYDDSGQLTYIVSTGVDITEERRAQEALRGIEEIGTLLAKQGPTASAIAATVRILSQAMGYPYLVLFIRDPEEILIGHEGDEQTNVPNPFDPTAGIIGRAFRTGKSEFVSDVSKDPDYYVGNPLVTSEIAVPFAAEGITFGAMSIEATAEMTLTLADLRLAQAVAERLSAALLLGREQRALAERARLFAALTGFARTANSTLDSDRLAPTLLDAIEAVIPSDSSALVAISGPNGRGLIRALRGANEPGAVGTEIDVAGGLLGRALATRAVAFDRTSRDTYGDALRSFMTVDEMAFAAVPLIRDGTTLGALMFGRPPEHEPPFSELEAEVLPLVAAQAALALANADLLEEVSELATHDPLTGLYNRRYLDSAADQILARRKRDRKHRPPVTAIMFDLDHFGQFNKEHGHAAGDVVLRAFARILVRRFRATDLVARYGGEEFVAFLEEATVDDAAKIAEQVRSSLEHRRIRGPDGIELHATVSGGCAELDEAKPTRQALLRAADACLLIAKREGRNRIAVA